MNYMQNNEEWSYFLDKNGCAFQLFGDELQNGNSHVAILEYIFNLSGRYNNLSSTKRNGVEYYRAGISHNTEKLKQLGLTQYIHFCEKLNREIVCIPVDNISNILTPNRALKEILLGERPLDPYVKKDLFYLIDMLKKNISTSVVDFLGVEGSLCFGVAHKSSDIDIIVNGQTAFEELNKAWKNIIHNDSKIYLLEDLPDCQKSLLDDRKKFIPYSEDNILYHEQRKNYAYIIDNHINRKINIVGKLSKTDPLYIERQNRYFSGYSFKSQGLCYVRGITKTDNLGNYIPSIYDTELINFKPLSNKTIKIGSESINYIIDYIGSYYMHLRKGEIFDGVGMLEEIYYLNNPTRRYRLSLNPWDGHVENGMYLKSIAKNYDEYIRGDYCARNINPCTMITAINTHQKER